MTDPLSSDPRNDERLMDAYRNGDPSAFDELFARHRGPLFTFLLQQTGSRAAAEDLFQEVFLRVIKRRDDYHSSGRFRAWLFTIAYNALTDSRRRAGARADTTVGDGELQEQASQSDRGDPVAGSQARELRERIAAALMHLPAEQRDVFLLRERAGLDFKQIAATTGDRLATVKSRMRYALEGLRRRLSDELLSCSEGPHE